MTARLALLIAGIATVTPALAQSSEKVMPWPPVLNRGTFWRAVLGTFTGDDRQSAIVRRGEKLFLVYNPAIHESVSSIAPGLSATDVVTLPSHSAAPRDRFLVSGDGAPAVGTLEADGTYTWRPVLDETWIRARGVTYAEDRIPGGGWLAAIAADGQTVLTAFRPTGTFDPVPYAAFDPGAEPRELHCIDWDGNGTNELAIVHDTAVTIAEMDGSSPRLIAASMTGMVGAVLDDGANPASLALVGESNDATHLFVASEAGNSPLQQIDSSALGVSGPLSLIGLAAGDTNADGDPDLLLSHLSSHVAMLLRGQRTGTFVEVPLTVIETPTGQPEANLCAGILGDTENNALDDALFFLDSESCLKTFFDPALAQTKLIAQLIEFAIYDGTHLDMGIPIEHGQGYTHIQALVWHQDDPTISAPPLDDTATLHQQWTLSAIQLGNHYRVPVKLDPGLGSTFWIAHDHYYAELRFYDQATGAVSQSVVASLTMQDDPQHPDVASYLMSLKGAEDPPVTTVKNTRAETVGIILVNKEPPPFPPDVLPKPGPLIQQ